tara:strand:+ start:33836 stop:40282 length:6447 start_codon:yes stop_codon:yes gene_type:complete
MGRKSNKAQGWRYRHAPTPPSANGIGASTTITATNAPTAGTKITIRTSDGSSQEFTCHGSATTATLFSRGGSKHGLDNLKTSIESSSIASKVTVSAVAGSGGGPFVITITQNKTGVAGNTIVTSNLNNYTIGGASSAASNGVFSGGFDSNQQDNTEWWKYRAQREEILSSGDSGVDSSKGLIFSASVQAYNRNRFAPARLSVDKIGLRRDLNRRQFIFAETAPLTNNNLKTNTTTFAKDVITNDTLKVNPNYKFKPEFATQRGTDSTTAFSGRLTSPVVFYTSSVGSQNTDPTGYFKTSQHLQDYYLETKEIPAQGPFTEQHVGGYQYRHTGINIGLATTRQEGWYTTTTELLGETYFVIYNPSAIAAGYPRAGYSRDHIAKSPVNIKNIKNITSSNNPGLAGTTNDLGSTIALGNYSHDYEIIQIPDRAINNRYFVENDGISTSSVASAPISGLYDRTVPDRGTNKHIFVNRFSSPGGPDTMGAGYLDAESETFSVYNALPYRNLAVRSPLREMLKNHSPFGGQSVAASTTITATNAPTAGRSLTIVTTDGAFATFTCDGSTTSATLFSRGGSQHGLDNLKTSIEASTIASKVTVSYATNSYVLTITQNTAGSGGNTSIVSNVDNYTIEGAAAAASNGKFSGGAGIDGVGIASFHKTQRNAAKRIVETGGVFSTGTVYDNAFVQHMIPQSDMQYSWVTASATNVIFGYEQPNNSNASLASTDITFVSASITGAHQSSGEIIPVDFVGLNSNILKTLTTGSNLIEATSSTDLFAANAEISTGLLLNSINLNLNGASGFPSWKQVRQADNPIVKDMRKNNRLSVVKETQTLITNDQGTQQFLYPKTLVSYIEPPVSSKFKPLRHQVMLWNYQKEDGTGGEEIIIDSSYANNLAYFTMTNTAGVQGVFDSLTDILGFEPEYAKQVYDDLKRIYINNENGGLVPGANPIRWVPSFTYKEVVYPRESYTFLAKTRMRENYGEASGSDDFNRASGEARTFWRDNPIDRLRSIGLATSAFGSPIDVGTFKTTSYENVIDLSCWPLDAHYPVVDIAPTGADGFLSGTTITGKGEGSLNLPASISLKSLNGELSYNNWIYNLYRVPVQGLNTSYSTTLNGTSPISASLSYEYPNFALSGNDPNQSGSNYTIAHMSLIPNWTANITASRNPWFDSYDDYSNDIRRIGKDFTVIPEFRISDHIEYYLKQGFGAANRKFVDLIGASTSITASADSENATSLNEEFYRIYSHTDFMKHFDVFADDHTNTSVSKENTMLNPSKIKIKCKGIKKLLPYQGFYPALRTVQLGQLFSSSYGPHLTGNYDNKSSVDSDQQTQQLASLIQPFFAPGIMFNTIKSGIAVDWPVITGSIEEKIPLPLDPSLSGIQAINSAYGFRAGGYAHFHPDYRLPFEALISPEKHLPVFNPNTIQNLADRPDASLYHIWPNYLNADLGQSNQARRYSTLVHYGSGAADNYISGSEEFKSWYSNAGYSRPTPNFAWKGEFDSRYNLAMSNFMAETVDFFLEDQQVTTFVSKPEKDFKTMVSGTTYFLDVVLSKTDGFKMYEGPDNLFNVSTYITASSRPASLRQYTSSVGARGMHYGPNFSPRYPFADMGTHQDKQLDSLQDPAPAPYTPPYFYGTSVARVAFRPHALRDMEPGDSDKFTLSEILSSAEIETRYLNFGENSNGRFLENSSYRVQYASAFLNQMQVNSSVNLFQRTGQKKTTYIPVFGDDGSVSYKPNSIVEPDNTENDVWIIESKFECPTLDFSNHNILNTYRDGDGNERELTTGMWRTFGQIPEQNAGIFLQIKNPFEQITNATEAEPKGTAGGDRGPAKISVSGRAGADRTLSIPTTGSLADVCGFDIKKKRVGQLAESKVISEAIVAIPINTDGTKVNIPKKAFATQLNNLEKEGLAVKKGDFPGITEDIKRTSITDMIQKMKKFVIPPHLDFVNNKEVDPFVMYIFDFNHKLTKQDLSYIWQNLMPDISLVAEESESIIEHPFLTGPNLEFFGVDPKVLSAKDDDDTTRSSIFPKDIRWMVFKVKQRGKNNYFGASLTQDDNKGFGLSELDPKGKLGVSGKQLTYSYNWPYDFFSLVELGKIETSITFEPTKLDPRDQDDPRLEDRIKNEESERREVSQEVKERDQVNWSTTSVKGNQEKQR